MNKYNPQIHHRRSIRLKGYDYAQAGLYFITICCQDRACLFGDVTVGADLRVCPAKTNTNANLRVCPDKTNTNADLSVCPDNEPKMILNDAGKMIEKWYHELQNKFPDIRCHEMVVMPNHFHCILENAGTVGAYLRVCPNKTNTNANLRVGPDNVITTNNMDNGNNGTNENDGANENDTKGEHVGSPLHRVVQWFKTMTTNEYIRGVKTLGWQPFNGKLWQRNYYEHIIRNEQSYQTISEYIINNPSKWVDDKFYTE